MTVTFRHGLASFAPMKVIIDSSMSAKTVLDSFVWPEASDWFHSDDELMPFVDLTDLNSPQLIVQACETWSILQLKGHGILTKLMEDMESEAISSKEGLYWGQG
ncbi:hypothetical protein ACLB2K_022318 [Fragaria x ananassa]